MPPSRISRTLGLRRWLAAALVVLAGHPVAASALTLADEVTALVAAGRAGDALQRTGQALLVSPRDGPTRFLHGVVLMELGRDAEALDTFTRLAQEFPELPEPLNNIALLHARAGRLDAARVALESALRNDPSHRAARANLAELHLMLAVAAWQQLAAEAPLEARQTRRLEAVRALLSSGAR